MECFRSRRLISKTKYFIRFLSEQRGRGTASAEKEKIYSSDKKTHFGFETVSEESKFKKVTGVFENVATSYDLMNDCMSFGVHRVWKDILIHRLRPKYTTKLIDVAGGTGDIAFRFLKHQTVTPVALKGPTLFTQKEFPSADSVPLSEVEAQYQVLEESRKDQKLNNQPDDFYKGMEKEMDTRSVLVCDINPKMLEVGQNRSNTLLTPNQQQRISWLEADAENMDSIPSNTFDVYTIAFGIRNCVHIDRVLSEAYRVLRPGGRFLCLEFSHVPNSLLKWVYDQYSFQIIPVMGQVVVGDWDSYIYLVESIRNFPNQDDFKKLIQKAGFKFVAYDNLTFGITAIHSGIKL